MADLTSSAPPDKTNPNERRTKRRAALEAFRGCAKGPVEVDAAHCADFLYDEFGLPT